ncbi:HAD family hydrolase [Paraburkholderia xenovorans]|uniref:HAD family hydrolase n=1 Tax=Paraburkholderia xenovorans TaxID=36873 RepID=UPI0038B897C7
MNGTSWKGSGAFSALLFDMDGTLIDSREAVARTWRHWAARHGIDFHELLSAAHGRRTRDTVQMFCPDGVDAEAETLELERRDEVDAEGIVPVKGATKLLRALPPDRWAIVTSAGRRLASNRLAAAGLPLPNVLITAESVQRGKPDPEGYALAAQLLGVDVTRCLVFEDAEAGIAAGRATGATVLAVTDAQPYHIVSSVPSIANYEQVQLFSKRRVLWVSTRST